MYLRVQCPDCAKHAAVKVQPMLVQMVLVCRPPIATVLVVAQCPACRKQTLEVRVRDVAAADVQRC